MPTLMQSAPASIRARAPSPVAMLPATTCTAFDSRLMRATASSTGLEWPVRGVDHDQVDPGLDQRHRCGRKLEIRPPWWRAATSA